VNGVLHFSLGVLMTDGVIVESSNDLATSASYKKIL